jgi:hypothetical protein
MRDPWGERFEEDDYLRHMRAEQLERRREHGSVGPQEAVSGWVERPYRSAPEKLGLALAWTVLHLHRPRVRDGVRAGGLLCRGMGADGMNNLERRSGVAGPPASTPLGNPAAAQDPETGRMRFNWRLSRERGEGWALYFGQHQGARFIACGLGFSGWSSSKWLREGWEFYTPHVHVGRLFMDGHGHWWDFRLLIPYRPVLWLRRLRYGRDYPCGEMPAQSATGGSDDA